MASLSKSIFDMAARHVNRVLGDTFTYVRKSTGEEIPNLKITINRNSKVFNEVGTLVGFKVEASIVATDLAGIKPRQYDYFYNDAERWQVVGLTIENSAKWYVDVDMVRNG